jgi:hypothetical protein
MEFSKVLPQVVFAAERAFSYRFRRTVLEVMRVPMLWSRSLMIAKSAFPKRRLCRLEFIEIRRADPYFQREMNAFLVSRPVVFLLE